MTFYKRRNRASLCQFSDSFWIVMDLGVYKCNTSFCVFPSTPSFSTSFFIYKNFLPILLLLWKTLYLRFTRDMIRMIWSVNWTKFLSFSVNFTELNVETLQLFLRQKGNDLIYKTVGFTTVEQNITCLYTFVIVQNIKKTKIIYPFERLTKCRTSNISESVLTS